MKHYRFTLCLLIGLITIFTTNSIVKSLQENSLLQNHPAIALQQDVIEISGSLPALPTVISDAVGDNTRAVDVIEIAGASTEENLIMKVTFSSGTNITATEAGGAILLDLDQNPDTGKSAEEVWFALPTQVVGFEFLLSLYVDRVEVREAENSTVVATMPVTQTTDALSFSIPMNLLNNDEGRMNIVAILGDKDGPTDWAPEVGYGVIAAPFSQFVPLILNP